MAVRRPAALDEAGLFAEYPFLPGAESLVAGLGASVGALLADPVYARSRELGRLRILAAVEDPTAAPGLEELARSGPEERYLSFQYARLLLSVLSQRGALRRWAVAEAKGAGTRLRPGPGGDLREVASRLGFDFGGSSAEIRIRIPDYLRLSSPIREGEFRLVYQRVRNGWVHVRWERAARLLQEGIRVTLSQPIELEEAVRSAVTQREGEFLSDVARRAPTPTARTGTGVTRLRPELFPPCIRKMRRMLQEGENLSHAGRFALAAFLHRAGANTETIVDSYRGAPDFDEGITRYQVEHITQRDGGQGYAAPECATIRTHGLCLRAGDPSAASPVDREPDALCFEEWLRHPLQYYRIRGGTPVERSAESADGGPVRS
jgi:DNA primase large subunit